MRSTIIAMSAFILILTLPLIILANASPYFASAFDRLHVYANFTEDQASLDNQFSSILSYIRPPFNTELDPSFFSPEDIWHMQDVQSIFKVLYALCVLSSIGVISYFFSKPKHSEIQRLAGQLRVFIAFSLLLLVLGLILWEYSFIWLHQVMFPHNEYWQLDPNTSSLINFLPEQVFQELAIIYIFLIVIEFVLLTFYSKWLMQKSRRVS